MMVLIFEVEHDIVSKIAHNVYNHAGNEQDTAEAIMALAQEYQLSDAEIACLVGHVANYTNKNLIARITAAIKIRTSRP